MKSLNAQNLARPVHGGGGGCVGGGAGAGAHHPAVTPHRDLVVSINSDKFQVHQCQGQIEI